jgi:hypothetical protein
MRVKGVPSQHSSFRPYVHPIVSLWHTPRALREAGEFPYPPSISLLPEPKAFAPPASRAPSGLALPGMADALSQPAEMARGPGRPCPPTPDTRNTTVESRAR